MREKINDNALGETLQIANEIVDLYEEVLLTQTDYIKALKRQNQSLQKALFAAKSIAIFFLKLSWF